MKFYLFIRRIIDTIIALVAMIILSPVLLAVAIAVCVDSKGGAIFKQKRSIQHILKNNCGIFTFKLKKKLLL